MRGAPAARAGRSVLAAAFARIFSAWIGVVLFGLVGLAGPASALDFFEDRLAIHGFYEMDLRAIWEDFTGANDMDFSSWGHTLNLEIEGDIAPDGFGPFDMITAFARVEVRYDCIWRRNCYLAQNANVYGDRPKRLPQRLTNGRRSGYSGEQFLGDTRRYNAISSLFGLGLPNVGLPADSRKGILFSNTSGFDGFFGIAGPDSVLGSSDDPGLFTFEKYFKDDCQFGHRRHKGPLDGIGSSVLPLTPGCTIRTNAALRDRPNPLKSTDINVPVLGGMGGGGALPLRPAPRYNTSAQVGRAPDGEAQGVFFPNHKLAQILRDSEFDNYGQNFTVNELQWNRGESQQDEKELKEAYLDLEMLGSRLWLRIGRQNIVWGKTEFFRTTDQFNPLDLVLSSSFQGLESSRIALWAARAVWSFYDVGPLEDVRIEIAANYDDFQGTDLGRCGEPYTPLAVCGKTWGGMAHGLTGIGAAGEIRPPNPWNSWKGIEVGGRLEFRYDRFSFALMDFYGYSDGFYLDRIFDYSRNVDPVTGRPRKGMNTGSCRTGREDACLTAGNALAEHSINQQIFHMICSGSVGFSALDRTACGQTVFNSQAVVDPTNFLSPTVVLALSNVVGGTSSRGFLAGAPGGAALYELQLSGTGYTPSIANGLAQFCVACSTYASFAAFPAISFKTTPLVQLNRDVNDIDPALAALGVTSILAIDPDDGLPYSFGEQAANKNSVAAWSFDTTLASFLTPEQEALLGCGPFYGTDCDRDGLDLMNAEFSAWAQAFPSSPGTFGTDWDTTDRRLIQPGTVGFDSAVCTRYERGRTFILPGCRGPGDAGYDPGVDGTINIAGGGQVDLLHPFTGQQFKNEMAAVSWNYMMFLIANSTSDDDPNGITAFNVNNAFRTDGCSYRRPQFCSVVSALYAIHGVGLSSVKAGGNGRFGRADFVWANSGDAVLRYEKRNVLGFSTDFAEDVTKSNWGMEFTWVEGLPSSDARALDGNSEVDQFNLTVSIDRPTFINFLNANRTFFFNLQFATQYIGDHTRVHSSSGPWNFFGVFFISTGYFQDRLLPGVTFIYDKRSNGGAVLTSVTYRFTENFSSTFGMNFFSGREEFVEESLWPTGGGNRFGRHRDKSSVENFTAAVRDRDEVFLRLRYTF